MIITIESVCPICKESLTISTDDIDKKYLAEKKEEIEEFELKHKKKCGK